MMNRLTELKLDAMDSCDARGHHIDNWTDHPENSSMGVCSLCGSWVTVILNPGPNEIEIGGPAVAICCDNGGESDMDHNPGEEPCDCKKYGYGTVDSD